MTDLDKMARELLCSNCDMDAEDHYDEMPVTAAEAESAIRTALLTAPPGWKLVPVEATLEQLAAGQAAWLNDPMRRSSTLYRAMIAAAPEPTTCTCPPGDGSLRWPCPRHPPE